MSDNDRSDPLPNETSPAEALAAGTPALIGRYAYDGTSWAWSETMYAMHGFEAGSVVPSSDLMVAHADPEDVSTAQETFKQALVSGEPYTSYHHLLDATRKRRTVLVAGAGRLDADGRVVELHGYMVDLTEVVATDTRAMVDAAIAGVTEHRAVIEQAKGVVMVAFGVTSDQAFEVLRAHSQDNNIKVHHLAEKLVEAVAGDESFGDGPAKLKVLAVVDELTG